MTGHSLQPHARHSRERARYWLQQQPAPAHSSTLTYAPSSLHACACGQHMRQTALFLTLKHSPLATTEPAGCKQVPAASRRRVHRQAVSPGDQHVPDATLPSPLHPDTTHSMLHALLSGDRHSHCAMRKTHIYTHTCSQHDKALHCAYSADPTQSDLVWPYQGPSKAAPSSSNHAPQSLGRPSCSIFLVHAPQRGMSFWDRAHCPPRSLAAGTAAPPPMQQHSINRGPAPALAHHAAVNTRRQKTDTGTSGCLLVSIASVLEGEMQCSRGRKDTRSLGHAPCL